MAQKWWNDHIIETKWVRMLIFVPTTPFSYQRSSFITFSDTSNNRIPTILAPWVPKWLQKWFKMGEMTILSKLDELGCWFLTLRKNKNFLTLFGEDVCEISSVCDGWFRLGVLSLYINPQPTAAHLHLCLFREMTPLPSLTPKFF